MLLIAACAGVHWAGGTFDAEKSLFSFTVWFLGLYRTQCPIRWGLFMVCPHSQDANHFFCGKNLAHDAMLNIDLALTGTCKIAHQFFKMRRGLKPVADNCFEQAAPDHCQTRLYQARHAAKPLWLCLNRHPVHPVHRVMRCACIA